MELFIAQQKAAELQIDRTQVVREYWELVILKGLFDSPFGRDLIFKGGTALRLAYDSPRFSEDLDFSLLRDALQGKFSNLVGKIIAPFPELSLTDLEEKYYTGLQVNRDPGTPVVAAAAILLIGGLMLILFSYARSIWIRIDQKGDMVVIAVVGRSYKNQSGLQTEVQYLLSELKDSLEKAQ